MSYLFDFIKTFDDKEWQVFRKLDLVGKEELVRDAYARHAKSNSFSEQKLPAALQISQAHFDKINSVLLDKTIHQLYGNDYVVSLRSLHKKGLSQLMLHELKIMERSVLKSRDAHQQTRFYLAAFESLRGMFHPDYNSKLTVLYGKKYLLSLGKKRNIADDAYVALGTHQADMLAQSVAGNEEGYRPAALRVLKTWEKKLHQSGNPLAWFHYYFTKSNYIKYYGTDASEFIEALLQCVELLPKLDAETQTSFGFRIYCELGFGYVEQKNFKQAEVYYSKAYKMPEAKTESRAYQAGCYLNLCLINKNYKRADSLFSNFLERYLQPGVNRSLQFDVLLNALILQLHTHKFDKAFHYLQRMRAYRKNELSRMGQILIRTCETLYFYTTGDYKVCMSMANKNVKFLNRKENRNEQTEYYRDLFYTLLHLAKSRTNTVSFADAEKYKAKLKGGMYQIFNQLL